MSCCFFVGDCEFGHALDANMTMGTGLFTGMRSVCFVGRKRVCTSVGLLIGHFEMPGHGTVVVRAKTITSTLLDC